MNIAILKGNLTRDPDVRTINAGGRETQVANFTIAVNRNFKRADGTKDKETTYVDCEAWDTGAKAIGEWLKKGDPILVNGSLKLDTWETDGQKRSKLKLRVSNFERLYRAPARTDDGSGATASDLAVATATATTASADASPDGDEIPF